MTASLKHPVTLQFQPRTEEKAVIDGTRRCDNDHRPYVHGLFRVRQRISSLGLEPSA